MTFIICNQFWFKLSLFILIYYLSACTTLIWWSQTRQYTVTMWSSQILEHNVSNVINQVKQERKFSVMWSSQTLEHTVSDVIKSNIRTQCQWRDQIKT